MLTLQLKPGVGLGPFILGKSLRGDPSSLLPSTAQMHPTPNPGFLPSKALAEASSSLVCHKLIGVEECAGQALGQAVQHIQGRKQEYRCIEVKYAEEVSPSGPGSGTQHSDPPYHTHLHAPLSTYQDLQAHPCH